MLFISRTARHCGTALASRLVRVPAGAHAASIVQVRLQHGKKKTKAVAAATARPPSASDVRGGASKGGSSQEPARGSGAATSRNGTGIEGDIIFTVHDLAKTLPGGRVLFADITLAFQRGAKIGVLGLNGCGAAGAAGPPERGPFLLATESCCVQVRQVDAAQDPRRAGRRV